MHWKHTADVGPCVGTVVIENFNYSRFAANEDNIMYTQWDAFVRLVGVIKKIGGAYVRNCPKRAFSVKITLHW